VQRLRSAGEPDLVLLQETVDWDKYGHKQLDLDMDAMPIPLSSSGCPPTLLYRRGTIGRWKFWNTDFAHAYRNWIQTA
jgi:hypothetical protein